MLLKDLTPRLKGVRRGGRGIVALCPAHDDRKPSLSVTEGAGRLYVKCFAGCTTETIVKALGIMWKDLFDKSITAPSTKSLGESLNNTYVKMGTTAGVVKSRGRIHEIYPYVDEEGRLLYENVRYYPKGFRQRRFNVAGEPVWNLEGVRRVPYRLPELIEARAQGKDVFLCEGEKDADALRELGFTATSFKNWREEFNEFIQGQHVIVCQDHDQPGVTQANEAAKLLIKSAASLKLLDMYPDRELPENHGLDISDYIRWCVEAEGADTDTLKERICITVEHTPNWKNLSDVKPGSFFKVMGGNEWTEESKLQKASKRLFGEFWYEREVSILFADTNVGKSILAVQIADAISRGTSADPEGRLATDVEAQKVVYFDFELTAKQFEARFAEAAEGADEFTNHYRWHPNFYRAEINPDSADIAGFAKLEDFISNAFEETVKSTGAKVLIIDNITYLRDETENARNALPMMKFLKALKAKYDISILVLAHTPKRDSGRPIGRNDLQGSKMIINFCDSAFAIGESAKQPGVRYLKQIKARNTEIIYDTDNVLLASIRKDVNFLRFYFEDTAGEQEHLKVMTPELREEMVAQVHELRKKGYTQRNIAKKVGISTMTVNRYLKRNVTVEEGIQDTEVTSNEGPMALEP